jgi:hypothetical protein
MKILAIIALVYLLLDTLYGIHISGFPSFQKYPNLSYMQSIKISGVLEPYARIFVSILLASIIFLLIKSEYISRIATEQTRGTVIAISYSDMRMNNKPLVNIEVSYLDQKMLFENLPGNFGFEFNKGDLIPVNFKKGSPNIATINENAIEIVRGWNQENQQHSDK